MIAKDAGIPTESLKENVPIQDANSAALKAVQAAGDGGGVILNFTPPEALKILQAAQQQGLQDRVKWSCSTPCNTDFIADALGDRWEDKLGVNAELNLTSHDGPDTTLYRSVVKKYAPKIPLGSFSQMGFLQGKIATEALLGSQGRLHGQERQRRVQEREELRDGHPLRAVVLRRCAAAHPEPHGLHHHSERTA